MKEIIDHLRALFALRVLELAHFAAPNDGMKADIGLTLMLVTNSEIGRGTDRGLGLHQNID